MSIEIGRTDLYRALNNIIEKMGYIDATEGVVDLKLRVYHQDELDNTIHEEISCELCQTDAGNWEVEELQYIKDTRNWFGKTVEPVIHKSW